MKSPYFDEYIMVAPGSDYGTIMWSDLKSLPNCTYYDYVIDGNRGFISILHHIHFSFVLNKRFDLPFHSLWRNMYSIKIQNLDNKKKYCIIFTDISACRVDCLYLKKLSSLPNVSLVMAHANLVKSKERLLEKRYKYFSLLFATDKSDCDKYGFIHHTTYYSGIDIDSVGVETNKSDAFFVGVAKGNRYNNMLTLYKYLNKHGLKADFYIAKYDGNKREDGIHYNEWLSYREVLNRVRNTNCIVEIVGEEQNGLTLRSIEAIHYNKRLLTDNPAVKQLKYYSTGYMQFFDDIEKVDLSFITDNTPIDYHYTNEYSPLSLIDHINAVMEKNIQQ